jgi:hypothetical protein
MAAASRWPDPYDPANDLWWRTHDRIEAIASDAATITDAARAALAQLRGGHDADLDDLADRLDRWWWTRDSLDLAAERATLLDPRYDPGTDR